LAIFTIFLTVWDLILLIYFYFFKASPDESTPFLPDGSGPSDQPTVGPDDQGKFWKQWCINDIFKALSRLFLAGISTGIGIIICSAIYYYWPWGSKK